MMSDTVRIRSCASKQEAEFFRGLLETSGIHAMVSADDYIGLPLQTSGGVDLLVLEDDAERARQILEASSQDPPPSPPAS